MFLPFLSVFLVGRCIFDSHSHHPRVSRQRSVSGHVVWQEPRDWATRIEDDDHLKNHVWSTNNGKPFAAVQYLMNKVLSAVPGERVDVQFQALDGTDLECVPETLQRFYRGELEVFDDLNQIHDNRKRRTVSFRLDLAYRGTDFCGWQTQDQKQSQQPVPAVQDVVQNALSDRDVRVAGRTDAGVHAVGQVARVRCDTGVTAKELEEQLQAAAAHTGSWTCRRVMPVSHSFHPTFGATSRTYIYLIDAGPDLERNYGCIKDLTSRLNALLAPLEGQVLPYLALSYGRLKTKTSNCTLHHVRARLLQMDNERVLALELIGDRFLRRMVRILVATAFRLALASDKNFDDQALWKIVKSRDRRQAALPAPPEGLIFVTASFYQQGYATT